MRLARTNADLESSRSRLMWEIGDWLRSGEDEVLKNLTRRQVRHLAAEVTGYSRNTLNMAVSVARRVDPSVRVDGLTWWHHLAVAGLDQRTQGDWLTRAAEECWSVKELREALNGNSRAKTEPASNRASSLVSKLVAVRRRELSNDDLELLRAWWAREIA